MDVPLLLTVTSLVLFGLLMVYSASFIFAQERSGDGFALIKKQLGFALLGGAGLVAACRTDYRRWSKWATGALALAGILLILVRVPGIGVRVGGAQRWLRLGWLQFQPGELAKFAVLMFVAWQLDRKKDRLQHFAAGVVSPYLLTLPVLLLLLAQPDFGTVVMVAAVVFAQLFLAQVPLRHLAVTAISGLTVGALLAMGTAYRRARVMAFLDPWVDPAGKGFQIIQSMLGLHNGGVWGVGLGNSKEKLFYLPEAHNDFIAAVIGEELGFLGLACMAAAYLFLLVRGLQLSWRCFERTGDRFALYLGSGITLALSMQGFVNMAVVLGLLPTKGLNLPFISYGGSSLVIDLFAVGILLSIGRGPVKT